jgi:hypothetical protein
MSAPDVNAKAIRDFVKIIVTRARAATQGMAQPGLLQVSLVHRSVVTLRRNVSGLTTSAQLFAL